MTQAAEQALSVYLRTERVGRLWLDAGRRFIFQYDPDWLANPGAVPLSLQLPLQPEAFEDDRARPFFANLLPESDLRRTIARRLGLSEQNDFALLEAVGGECAGAVSVLSADIPLSGAGSYKPLNDDALNALVAELPRRPMLAGEEGVRLSLAGAQNKLPVYFDGQAISLPMGAVPSSHILKPPIPDYPDSVYNEAFCLQLAEQIGLRVPTVTLLHKQTPLYLVERYARRRTAAGGLERVHQEDFCQALGIPPDQKYEKEGGPNLQQCFTLLREQSISPVADIRALLDWVIFNYLIGNADAHAKNISLLLSDGGPHLAPFYDLMSTAVYPDLSERLAMHIGGEDRPNWVIAQRWEQFAKDVDIGYKLVRQVLVEMSQSLEAMAADLAAEFQDRHGHQDINDRILNIISERCHKVLAALDAQKA
ncbi:type II toxin-antitoxin system HipA family toxin [Thiohalobacter thiocyanaticus]|uniref:Type II toxin-antitoxin system HipA family toxin n=1 Tax=Thiohalobacter thiocyanaticus TaxID=585455 RepID=A0A426QLU2_9GAMM|nr:type II toxin-antitoxin system HipA family toxin [Thiohalobacter thiocyanaticus]RRQ22742.1 type II toxin-antitoxin system HipA family toxin [Thiohalobacter thiocyanaticus]